MKRILINYADKNYRPAQILNAFSGKIIGKFDIIHQFGPNDIDDDFKNNYKEILSSKRGNGLWLWKPYFINRVINNCNEGDLVFYCDSGSIFIRSVSSLESYITDEEPLFVTDIPLIESNWTKPDCFKIMNCEYPDVMWTNQVQATFLFIKVNEKSKQFIKEWLKLCCQPELISPEGLKKNDIVDHNYDYSFVSHREDQSILSLLCKTKGIKPHRDISQRGFNPQWYFNKLYAYQVSVHKTDVYNTIVYLHKSNNPLLFFLKLIIKKIVRR